MINYLLNLSLEYSITCSIKSNMIVAFHKLRYDFPILYSKYAHLVCVEAQAPLHLWSIMSATCSKYEDMPCNMSEKYYHASFVLDILHQKTLDYSLSSQLFVKYNIIPIILFYEDEFIVSRFLFSLKSDPGTSIEIINILKHAIHTNHSPAFIKGCICLSKYIHVSVLPTFIFAMKNLCSLSR